MVLSRYFEYVKALSFEQEPNYDYLRKLFRETLVKRKEEGAPFSWEKLDYEPTRISLTQSKRF